ncbi:MAG: hypothetical protein JWO58_789 [Chitinophagaceae bacterium]|nr:hypothetical protein [Chitinophagaceae bacterium]
MSSEELSFEAYCKKKKIDPDLFLQSEPARYKEWKSIFEQVHPDSFTEQKKFLINPIRKKYLLVTTDSIKKTESE